MNRIRKLGSREALANLWESLQAKFWLIPAVLTAFSFVLAAVSLELDREFATRWNRDEFWLFGGDSDAARDLLATIAGSLITVISVAFSITLVAIQQASTQYSPRILRRFTKDRGNQVVLGAYTATFVYALLILRDVRSSSDGAASDRFVPALSVAIALALTLVSVGLLVYFIHHITSQIQVSSMLAGIRQELDAEIRRLYPRPVGNEGEAGRSYVDEIDESGIHRKGVETRIVAPEDGYLQSIDVTKIIELTEDCHFVWIVCSTGEFLMSGTPVLRVWGERPLDKEVKRSILDQISIGMERSIHQDLLYWIRQMADVAVKALSPGVNDPATAEQCISELKGTLNFLMKQEIPPAKSTHGGTVYLIRRPGFADYVEKCFGQIRRNSVQSFETLTYFLDAIGGLMAIAPNEERRKVIAEQALRVRRLLEVSDEFPADDLGLLRERVADILAKTARRDQGPYCDEL